MHLNDSCCQWITLTRLCSLFYNNFIQGFLISHCFRSFGNAYIACDVCVPWSHSFKPSIAVKAVLTICIMMTSWPLLAICAGNSPAPGEFPTQRPVTRSFDKRLSKQSWGWWFETLSCPLSDVIVMSTYTIWAPLSHYFDFICVHDCILGRYIYMLKRL